MAHVRVTFKVLKGVTPEQMIAGKVKPGFKYVGTHIIFDIKMDSKFNRKSRLVEGGHKTAPPSYITYSSVVTRESVRLAFIIAVVNNLDIFALDIGNAYPNAPCRRNCVPKQDHNLGVRKDMFP